MRFQRIAYSGKTCLKKVVLFAAIALLSASYGCVQKQDKVHKIVPEQLIWQHPDSALLILNSYNVEKLDNSQQQTKKKNKIKASQRVAESILPHSLIPLFR